MIGEDNMNWWEVLKNAKVSGKAKGKGSSFDASKIKINIDKDDCCEEFWKTIQEFMNNNRIVISSIRRLLFMELEYNEDHPNYMQYDFEGIGHKTYEGQTPVSPSPSEKPCEDSASIYIQLLKYAQEIDSTPDSGKMSDKISPFEVKHYKNSENLDKDIKEWYQLKDSFYYEWQSLERTIRKCPDLVAAIRKKGEKFI